MELYALSTNTDPAAYEALARDMLEGEESFPLNAVSETGNPSKINHPKSAPGKGPTFTL